MPAYTAGSYWTLGAQMKTASAIWTPADRIHCPFVIIYIKLIL